jgi:hypothetical protein
MSDLNGKIKDDSIDWNLIHLFIKLDPQSTEFFNIDEEYLYHNDLQLQRQQPVIDGEIQTLEQAKILRKQLLLGAYNIYLRTPKHLPSVDDHFPEGLLDLRRSYISQILYCNMCLEALCGNEPLQENLHPFARSSSLGFQTTILLIMLSYDPIDALTIRQNGYFLEQFKYILSFSKDVVDFERKTMVLPAGMP